jgi:eukaryotic-like serine/threonine-protein kinase
MTALDDHAVERLQQALREPDLEGTGYRLVGLLGRGGMGSVYEVEEVALQRRLALKVSDLPGDDVERRLRREAEVLATLEHPGVVPVHSVGTLADGRTYYAMKRVEGTRLDAASVRARALTERLRIFLKLAETVAFAHARGILHRDLKPQNVMLGPFGEVLVLDWGLAKRLGAADAQGVDGLGSAGDTGPGATLGTPGYMAPEQAQGVPAADDPRADLYSLGALLRFLVESRETSGPAALRAIVARAMAETPGDRYPDVPALAADVERYLAGEAVTALPEGPWARMVRLARRHRIALFLVLAYLVARAILFLFGRR